MKNTQLPLTLILISLFVLISTFSNAQTLIFGPQEFATWLPTGWASQNVSGNNWTQNTADGVGSTNCAAMSGSVASNSWLFTESFTAVAGQSYYLGYYDKYTNNGSFQIFVGSGAQTAANATQSGNLRVAALAGAAWAGAERSSSVWTCTTGGTYWFGIHCTNAIATVKFDKISCYKDCSTNTVAATCSQSNTSTITTCFDNAEVLSIVVSATIDNCATITSFTINANGSTDINDIKNARIWCTGTNPSFATVADFGSGASLFGTVAAPSITNFVLAGSKTLVAGNNYFWLTYDVKSTAVAGNVIDAECTSVSIGSAVIPTVTAPAGSRSISAPSTLPASFRTCASGTVLNLGNAAIPANTFSVSVSGTALTNPLSAACNLREVRVRFYGGTNEQPDKYTVTIKSPDGTSMVLFNNAFSGITAGSLDARFRYSTSLTLASAMNYSSGFTAPPEPFNQGFYCSQNNFNVFNGKNPNGTWQVIITESAAAGSDDFKLDYVELIFGPDFVENNVKTQGDNCSSAIGLSSGIYLGSTAYNPGATDPKNVEVWDPATTLSGCNWNGSNDNSQWFTFYATKNRVSLSISGLLYNGSVNNKLQTIVVENQSTPCSGTGANWNLVACPIAGSYSSNAGTYANHRLDFNAVIGTTYYLVIDGTAGGLNDFYIDIEGAMPPPAPLPIELLSFDGRCLGNAIELSWQTASETNNDYFSIQRSTDAHHFETIKTVPGQGNSNNVQSYVTLDESPYRKTSYYRLKQTDFDGSSSFSEIISVERCNDDGLTITFGENPVNTQLSLQISTPVSDNISLIIYDVFGRMLLRENRDLSEGLNLVKLDVSTFASGPYILTLRSEYSNDFITKEFIINH